MTINADVLDNSSFPGVVIDSFSLAITLADSVTGVVSGQTTTWTFPVLALVGESGGNQTNFAAAELINKNFRVIRMDGGTPATDDDRYDVFVTIPVPALSDPTFQGEDPLTLNGVSTFIGSEFDAFLSVLGDDDSLTSLALGTAADSSSITGAGSTELAGIFGSSGNSVRLHPMSVVPEPSMIGLVLLGGFGVGLRRKRLQ